MKSIRFPHLPPLNTLLAFEAAARHESFTRAADELCITASAVAHQVKLLEASLGIALFVRHPRGVSLSPQSRDYLGHVQQCLNDLHRHSEQVRDYTLRPLRISTQHAIAQLWLQPRLGDYQDQYPDRELEITAKSRIEEMPSDVDIAIAWFAEPPAGESWQLLWQEILLPVCHPNYKQPNPILYQDAHWVDDWSNWRQGFDKSQYTVLTSPFARTRSASLYVLVLQSVLDQRGVMVARKSLLQDYLDKGELVGWPETNMPAVNCGAYYLYQSPASFNNPFANDFREWLTGQAQAPE